MSTILNGKYSQFTADMKSLIEKASHMHLSIFSDSTGTTVINTDAGTPVSKLLITTTSYTYPHNDSVTGVSVLGTFVITFSDGNKVTIDDQETGFWYTFDEITPAVISPLV
jgi:hypothetical protein